MNGGAVDSTWRAALRSPWAVFARLLLFALATRAFTFGDLNFQQDELLFFLIGQRMHDGLLPYVDLWDRKPPGLFALYYLIAGVSESVLAYQLAACLSAALTALVIARLAARLGWRRGGVMAGLLYLAVMLQFGGAGGQAAVFFNLPMAGAALIVVSRIERLRMGVVDPAIYAAMACAGIAITFKQTALFEAGFLGLYTLSQLAKAQAKPLLLTRTAVTLALVGAAPMLGWAAYYAAIGHFAEFWHAMVLANLDKAYNPGGDLINRARLFAVELAPLALLAGASLIGDTGKPARAFLIGWLIAALIGFAIIPNLIDHYVLPVLVPLTLAAAPFLNRKPTGLIIGLGLIALYLAAVPVLDWQRGARSQVEMLDMVRRIRAADPQPRVLVFDGPVYLYRLTGWYPPTPLLFPLHINFQPERNVSHLDTAAELRKVLAARPTTVVFQRRDQQPNLYNPETRDMVMAYVRTHCATHFTHKAREMFEIHARCAPR